MILGDSWWFSNKSGIDSPISLNLIVIDSQWFSPIFNDSHWFSNKCEVDSHEFSAILNDCQISLKLILSDSHWFSVIVIDSWWFSNKAEIDSRISLKLILIDSWWFSVILGNLNDSQISLKLILGDSRISLKLDCHWFLAILGDSWWFSNKSEINSRWFAWGFDWFASIHMCELLRIFMIDTWLERGDSQLQNGTLFVKIS